MGSTVRDENQLGSTLQTSLLTVFGGDTTGIIIIITDEVCCMLGTSLIWVLIIWHTRRRTARH